jgi:hypothetical protein
MTTNRFPALLQSWPSLKLSGEFHSNDNQFTETDTFTEFKSNTDKFHNMTQAPKTARRET